MTTPLRVLFVGMEWDYGDRSRGHSHEWNNLYDALRGMDGIDASSFDFLSAHQQGGTEAVAAGLRAAVDEHDPDLAVFVLYEDQIPDEVLAELRDRPRPLTFNWFCDDHWRFEGFTSHYAPLFDAVSTTDRNAVAKYRAIGIEPILTQWACNPRLYHPTGGPIRHGVTFVGQSYGDRPWLVRRLETAGVEVQAWGPRWPAGFLDFDEMVATFAESRVNLNLTAASNDPRTPRLVRGVINRTYPPAIRWVRRGLDQIKGRTFEIPACGGLQLSSRAEAIEDFFEPDREIALFDSADDLVDQARRYLADDRAAEAVAAAGHRRALAEHTYEHRFRAILDELDLAP